MYTCFTQNLYLARMFVSDLSEDSAVFHLKCDLLLQLIESKFGKNPFLEDFQREISIPWNAVDRFS